MGFLCTGPSPSMAERSSSLPLIHFDLLFQPVQIEARGLNLKGLVVALQPRLASQSVWAVPLSLAATYGISFDFFSSGYLDVSVHPVPSAHSMYSSVGHWT